MSAELKAELETVSRERDETHATTRRKAKQ